MRRIVQINWNLIQLELLETRRSASLYELGNTTKMDGHSYSDVVANKPQTTVSVPTISVSGDVKQMKLASQLPWFRSMVFQPSVF